MKIKFNPKLCIGCLCCTTIQEFDFCGILIDSVRRGGPHFGEEKCDSLNCTKCIDVCAGHALTKYNHV